MASDVWNIEGVGYPCTNYDKCKNVLVGNADYNYIEPGTPLCQECYEASEEAI